MACRREPRAPTWHGTATGTASPPDRRRSTSSCSGGSSPRQKASAGRGELDEALDRYAEALRLGQGPAGDGLGDTPAARATLASLDGEFLDAVVAAAEIAIQRRRAATLDPLNEQVHASLMRTLAAAGHRGEALTVYRSIRTRLADELGIDAGQELQDAHLGVLTDPVPPSRATPLGGLVPPARVPPGLGVFAGRADELAVLAGLAVRLTDGGRTSPVVIATDGLVDAGTSTLAVHFVCLVVGDVADGQPYFDLRDESIEAGDGALRSHA